MARLELFSGRLGTPLPRLQTFLSLPCSQRMVPSCGSAAVSTTRGDMSCPVSVSASSNESLCSTEGWVARPGTSRYRSASTERVRPKAASLLETEAAVVMDSATTRSESTRRRTAFEAEVKAGRFECSSRGCQPIFDNSTGEECSVMVREDGVWGDQEAFVLLEARSASYIERRTERDLEICPDVSFLVDFAEFVCDVWKEKSIATKYFDIAMKRNPHEANMLARYAQFAWKTLGDIDKADELFVRALQESQEDSDLQSMYALFLWQIDQ